VRLFKRPSTNPAPPPFGTAKTEDRSIDWTGWGSFKTTPSAVHYLSARSPRYHGEVVLRSDRLRGDALRAFTQDSPLDTANLLAVERRAVDRQLLQKFLAIDCPPTHVISFEYEFIRDEIKSRKSLLQAAVSFDLPGHSAKGLAQRACEFLSRIAREEKSFEGASGTVIAPPMLMRVSAETQIFWVTALYRYYRSHALPGAE
jgi:hypothetical protein